ncbi:hypothetical protein PRUPE_2G018500 [Prunus persica]|uniref:DNA topoisomerase (ATP-hydrolyzing) n=1 Tax=Prunus persica TaxID=3760 RepID=A0A251QCU7_PRUPE|nr:hypothetical protein PRUPE_2G018500 [Prunus persica]
MAIEKKRPLQTSNSANIAPAPTDGQGKTIEEMYQKKSQLEHILLRPDTYIGSIEKHTQILWVYQNDEMVNRSISYVPGLYKIFDEILVNAADNKQRDSSMDSVKVTIDVEQNCISVYNNGAGVPVEIHQEEKVYVPELIFGHLLSSSNYDDTEKKTTGGRNGYGAKLTNIFSTELIIETADGKRQKKYKQVGFRLFRIWAFNSCGVVSDAFNLGGKGRASARYIYTRLSPITRFLFPKDDDRLLDYLNEDGQSIEPTWYVPIIPTVLVNGSEGIGTGWSSYIPNYNPRDIVANVRRLLNGEAMVPMDPWYRGFSGTIEKTVKESGVSYTVCGVIEEGNETTVRISELPIRRWTQDYKEFLESISQGNDKAKDLIEHSDHSTVDIIVHLPEETLMVARQEGLLKKFKLTTSISTSNMHLFVPKGVIKKYDTPEQILEEFFHLRLEFYEKRKKLLLDNLEMELLKLENKVRFILAVVNGEIIASNRRRADLFLELQQKGFTPFPKKTKAQEPEVAGAIEDTEETEENSESASGNGARISDYEYLISMAIGTLTIERVQTLCA